MRLRKRTPTPLRQITDVQYAWRVFHWDPDKEALASFGVKSWWLGPTKEANHLGPLLWSHPAPKSKCTCGLYGLYCPPIYMSTAFAVGLVACEGKTIYHEWGLRAQRMTLQFLAVNTLTDPHTDAVAALRQRYQVPVATGSWSRATGAQLGVAYFNSPEKDSFQALYRRAAALADGRLPEWERLVYTAPSSVTTPLVHEILFEVRRNQDRQLREIQTNEAREKLRVQFDDINTLLDQMKKDLP